MFCLRFSMQHSLLFLFSIDPNWECRSCCLLYRCKSLNRLRPKSRLVRLQAHNQGLKNFLTATAVSRRAGTPKKSRSILTPDLCAAKASWYVRPSSFANFSPPQLIFVRMMVLATSSGLVNLPTSVKVEISVTAWACGFHFAVKAWNALVTATWQVMAHHTACGLVMGRWDYYNRIQPRISPYPSLKWSRAGSKSFHQCFPKNQCPFHSTIHPLALGHGFRTSFQGEKQKLTETLEKQHCFISWYIN